MKFDVCLSFLPHLSPCFLRIEEELGSKAKFAGRSFRNPLAK